jgi:diacylglycerol kinase (ATP)
LKNQPSERPKGFVASLNCAIEGVLWAAKSQRHMLLHLLAAMGVLLLALSLRLTLLEFALLAMAIVLVLFAELINTALEVVVDLVSPEYHPLARRAKDVAAGAVLVASIGALIMGYLALSRCFFPPDIHASTDFLRTTGNLSMVAVVLVVLVVVLLKARVGRGTPLHGGMPSGHAAVACSVATSVAFAAPGLPILALAWLLAALVAHSRVLLGVHSFAEVFAGCSLGAGLTLVVHVLFR